MARDSARRTYLTARTIERAARNERIRAYAEPVATLVVAILWFVGIAGSYLLMPSVRHDLEATPAAGFMWLVMVSAAVVNGIIAALDLRKLRMQYSSAKTHSQQ